MLHGDRNFPVRLVADIDVDPRAIDTLHPPRPPLRCLGYRGSFFGINAIGFRARADQAQSSFQRSVFIIGEGLVGRGLKTAGAGLAGNAQAGVLFISNVHSLRPPLFLLNRFRHELQGWLSDAPRGSSRVRLQRLRP